MAAISIPCNSKDYSPGKLDLKGMRVGYIYPDEFKFTNDDGTDADISGDTFRMEIFNEAGTLIDTLTTGTLIPDGLEIVGTDKLKRLLGAPTTDAVGTYKYKLIITEAAGADYPLVVGSIPIIDP